MTAFTYDFKLAENLNSALVYDEGRYRIWGFRVALADELEPLGLQAGEHYEIQTDGSTRRYWRIWFVDNEAFFLAKMALA